MIRLVGKGLATGFLRDRRGSTVTFVGVGLPVLFGMAVLAVDLGHLHNQRNLLQIAADSASLAGAYALSQGASPVTAALEYADKNKSQLNGSILQGGDVVVGRWDTATRTVDPSGTPQNAVQVTTRRSQANGNPVNTYFAALLGYDSMDVNARAVAISGGNNDTGVGDCWESGARAGGRLVMGQDVELETTCVYGQDGVTFGQDSELEPEASVGTPDCTSYPDDCGGFIAGQGSDIEGNVIGMDLSGGAIEDDPTQTQTCILNFIAMLKGGYGSVDPDVPCGDVWVDHITNVVYDTTGTTLPNSPQPGTAYIFSNTVIIGQAYTLTDNFVISEDDINWGQNGRIINSVDSCQDRTQNTIGVFAVNDLALGQNARVRGAALWAGNLMQIGQNVDSLGASLRSGGDMLISQDPDFEGCEVNFDGALGTGGDGGQGGGEMVIRLVK